MAPSDNNPVAPDAGKLGFAPERLRRIDEHLARHYVEPGKIAGCQTLVARAGQVAYRSALGSMDLERGRPLRDDAIFRIYSMTKPVTSVALMMLYERGLFQLNDAVDRVLPELRDLKVYVSGEGLAITTRPSERPITFRHLLNHSAGLSLGALPVSTGALHPVEGAYRALKLGASAGDTLETFVQKLHRAPLRYEPGERWLYSAATDVCARLVEVLSGQRFDRYLQEQIFGPLGMRDTSFMIAPDQRERFAACYARNADKRLALLDDPLDSRFAREPKYFSGAGGLLSTLSDYHRFCEMLRRGGELDGARILAPRTIKLMTMNHLPGGRDLTQVALGAFSETKYEGVGFGLGFATTLDEVSSGGMGAGDYFWGGLASTLFWVDPREDLVVIFLTQLAPSATFNFRGQLKNLIYAALVD